MIVSTILLTENDIYAGVDGNLPTRPGFDKQLLGSLCKGKIVSEEGYHMLPPSIRLMTELEPSIEPEIGITIPEIDGLTDLLLVVRSTAHIDIGKKFRFDNFELIIKDSKIEIWKRK